MNRRQFLVSAGALLAGGLAGCGGNPEPRPNRPLSAAPANRRRRQRRRRRYRKIVMRRVNRNGRGVDVYVVPASVQPNDMLVLEDLGECRVIVRRDTELDVDQYGTERTVQVIFDGDDEGEEIE